MASFMSRRWLVLPAALLASAAPALALDPQTATSATAPKPPPAKPPSVDTGGFPQLSTSSATLKGGVNPHGAETSYAFQYGTTAGYGAQTAPVAVGGGTAEVKVSQTIVGLAPGTLYHYRLVAANSAGTTDGGDFTFTTKKIPLTFKLAATPDPSVFGSSFSVSGVMSGTGAAGQTVALQATPFPYLKGFKNTGATTVTNVGGSFLFRVAGLPLNTQFRVVTMGLPVVKSNALIERIAVRVSLHLSSSRRPGSVRMYGVVEPAVTGATVGFQLMRPGHGPLSVAGTKVKSASAGASRFSRIVPIRRGGLYRAIVRVDNGKQISGHSRSLLIR